MGDDDGRDMLIIQLVDLVISFLAHSRIAGWAAFWICSTISGKGLPKACWSRSGRHRTSWSHRDSLRSNPGRRGPSRQREWRAGKWPIPPCQLDLDADFSQLGLDGLGDLGRLGEVGAGAFGIGKVYSLLKSNLQPSAFPWLCDRRWCPRSHRCSQASHLEARTGWRQRSQGIEVVNDLRLSMAMAKAWRTFSLSKGGGVVDAQVQEVVELAGGKLQVWISFDGGSHQR